MAATKKTLRADPLAPSTQIATIRGASTRVLHSERRQGIALVLITMLLFAAHDALSKHLARYYPASELPWVRYLTHVVLIVALFGRHMGVARSDRPASHRARGAGCGDSGTAAQLVHDDAGRLLADGLPRHLDGSRPLPADRSLPAHSPHRSRAFSYTHLVWAVLLWDPHSARRAMRVP